MTLMKRMQHELDWPTSMARRFGDVPVFFGDLFDDSTIRVEEFETDGHLVIRAEMPGIDPEADVEITVENHQLKICAERRSETEESDVDGWRSEFRYGSFERTMPLPFDATEDDVTATYTDGILEIRVPVDHEGESTRRIPVSRSA